MERVVLVAVKPGVRLGQDHGTEMLGCWVWLSYLNFGIKALNILKVLYLELLFLQDIKLFYCGDPVPLIHCLNT